MFFSEEKVTVYLYENAPLPIDIFSSPFLTVAFKSSVNLVSTLWPGVVGILIDFFDKE